MTDQVQNVNIGQNIQDDRQTLNFENSSSESQQSDNSESI